MQPSVTGITTVDFVPALTHCESRDLYRRFENLERMHACELGGHALRHRRDTRGAGEQTRHDQKSRCLHRDPARETVVLALWQISKSICIFEGLPTLFISRSIVDSTALYWPKDPDTRTQRSSPLKNWFRNVPVPTKWDNSRKFRFSYRMRPAMMAG